MVLLPLALPAALIGAAIGSKKEHTQFGAILGGVATTGPLALVYLCLESAMATEGVKTALLKTRVQLLGNDMVSINISIEKIKNML